jgi:peptidyl-prolyl cis-trans isomerase C
MRYDKKTFMVLGLVTIFFTCLSGKENAVVARVNDYKITQYHINAWVTAKLQKTFFHQNLSEEKKQKLDKEALQELVERELLYQYAKEKNIQIDVQRIDEMQEKIIARFPSKAQFDEVLKTNDLSMELLRRDIAAEESMKLLYEKEIKSVVTQQALKEYYYKNKHKFVKPESKSLQILLINIDPGKKQGIEEAKKTINTLRERLVKGEDFAKIAQEYSHDMSRINGGKVGFIHKGRFKYLKDKDINLKVNELSKPIQTDIGFYVIKVLDIKEREQLSFSMVQKSLKQDLRRSLEKKKIHSILEKQRKKLTVQYF